MYLCISSAPPFSVQNRGAPESTKAELQLFLSSPFLCRTFWPSPFSNQIFSSPISGSCTVPAHHLQYTNVSATSVGSSVPCSRDLPTSPHNIIIRSWGKKHFSFKTELLPTNKILTKYLLNLNSMCVLLSLLKAIKL